MPVAGSMKQTSTTLPHVVSQSLAALLARLLCRQASGFALAIKVCWYWHLTGEHPRCRADHVQGVGYELVPLPSVAPIHSEERSRCPHLGLAESILPPLPPSATRLHWVPGKRQTPLGWVTSTLSLPGLHKTVGRGTETQSMCRDSLVLLCTSRTLSSGMSLGPHIFPLGHQNWRRQFAQ